MNDTADLLSSAHLPPPVQAFIDAAIVVGDLLMPQNYPQRGGFDAFQSGYRFNGIDGQDLTGDRPGQWRPGWQAVASNYFADPYHVDFGEADAGFPVYFSHASSGAWQPVRVTDTLERFGELLRLLAAAGDDPAAMRAVLEREVDLQREPWQEMHANLTQAIESPETETDAAPVDMSKWIAGKLVLTDAGERRLEVARHLQRRQMLAGTPAEALALLRRSPLSLELRTGYLVHLEAELPALQALGATVRFVPDDAPRDE